MTKLNRSQKILYSATSILLASILVLNVGRGDNDTNISKIGVQSNLTTEDSYVLDDITIDYRFDKKLYEVESLVSQPYAVLKGNAQVINKIRLMKKKPTFYVDLTNKKVGSYQPKIQYEGLDTKGVTVTVYPMVADLKLREQQTVNFVPVIELTGVDNSDESKLVVGSPILKKDEVRIRDNSTVLNDVAQVKGTVDVTNLSDTTIKTVKLNAYDRNGKLMKGVNLIDTSVEVEIPIDKKLNPEEEAAKNAALEHIETKAKEQEASDKAYKDSTNSLKKEKEQLDKTAKELDKREKTLQTLQEKLDRNTNTYDLNMQRVDKQAAELEQLRKELDEREKLVEEQEKRLKKLEQQNTSILDEQENKTK